MVLSSGTPLSLRRRSCTVEVDDTEFHCRHAAKHPRSGRWRVGHRLQSRLVFLLARLLPNLLGILTTAVLTRVLDPGRYGLYAFGLSTAYFVTIGLYDWLGLSLLRLMPSARDSDRFFGTVVSGFVLLSAFGALITLAVIVVAGLGSDLLFGCGCFAVALAAAWVELKHRVQMAELRAKDYFFLSTGRGVISAILVCATGYLTGDPALMMLALAAGIFIASMLRREPHLDRLCFKFNSAVCRSLLMFGIPLSVSVGLGTLLDVVDRWLLAGMLGTHSVGLFSAAVLVTQMPIIALAGGIGPFAYSIAVRAVEFEVQGNSRRPTCAEFCDPPRHRVAERGWYRHAGCQSRPCDGWRGLLVRRCRASTLVGTCCGVRKHPRVPC